MTFRLLAVLARDGFVELDETTKRHPLGLTINALGRRVFQPRGFGRLALPIRQQLSGQTREATPMSVLDGDRQLYAHYVEGPQQVSVIGEPGKHGPPHNTSMGNVLFRSPRPTCANGCSTRSSWRAPAERGDRPGLTG